MARGGNTRRAATQARLAADHAVIDRGLVKHHLARYWPADNEENEVVRFGFRFLRLYRAGNAWALRNIDRLLPLMEQRFESANARCAAAVTDAAAANDEDLAAQRAARDYVYALVAELEAQETQETQETQEAHQVLETYEPHEKAAAVIASPAAA